MKRATGCPQTPNYFIGFTDRIQEHPTNAREITELHQCIALPPVIEHMFSRSVKAQRSHESGYTWPPPRIRRRASQRI